MQAIKSNIHLCVGILLLFTTWLFVGIYRDDEFYEPNFFIKYRPTFKTMFYSPTGMSDLTVHDLSPDGQYEENAFQEFVIERDVQFPGSKLWFLPPILFQLTLTFLIFGIFKLTRVIEYRPWQTQIHFVISFIATFIGLIFIISADNLFATIAIGLVIIALNYLVFRLLTNDETS